MDTDPIIETSGATLQRVNTDLVVQRYRPGVTVTADIVAEILAARKGVLGYQPYALIVIIPEDADFNKSLLGRDHYENFGLDDVTRALAVVAEGSSFHRMAELYFAQFPTRFPTKVFAQLPEAMHWVEERLEERVNS